MAGPVYDPTRGILNYNPYDNYLEDIFKSGLDYIITHPPAGDWTLTDLNKAVLDYLDSELDFDTEGFLGGLFETIIPNTVDDFYNNRAINAYRQKAIIVSLYNGLKVNSISSLESYFNLANMKIINSRLSNGDKASLFMAVTITKASYQYWREKAASPGDWSAFLSANEAINYVEIPFWIGCSFKGTLSGFAQIQKPLVGGATVLNDVGRTAGIISGVTGALGLTAGKIFFNWAQKPVWYNTSNPVRR